MRVPIEETARKTTPSKATGPRRSGGRARGPIRAAANFLVVGIGASAGGLDACRCLLDGLPADNRMAFILIQHLDPTHESMMVDVLSAHTRMTVRQAASGMRGEKRSCRGRIPTNCCGNGGRHELRLEPSVARPQIYSCIGSRHWAGMVLEKRAVQIAID